MGYVGIVGSNCVKKIGLSEMGNTFQVNRELRNDPTMMGDIVKLYCWEETHIEEENSMLLIILRANVGFARSLIRWGL